MCYMCYMSETYGHLCNALRTNMTEAFDKSVGLYSAMISPGCSLLILLHADLKFDFLEFVYQVN